MSEPIKPQRKRRSDTDHAYEVGYGKPPKATQFKPGQSGNPRGRPQKDVSLRGLIEDELDRKIVVKDGGYPVTMKKREVIARRLVDQACQGDARALRAMREVLRETNPALAAPQTGKSVPLDQTDRDILAAYVAHITAGTPQPNDEAGNPGDGLSEGAPAAGDVSPAIAMLH